MNSVTALSSLLVLSAAALAGCSDSVSTNAPLAAINTFDIAYTKYDMAHANTDFPELLLVDTAGKPVDDFGVGYATSTAENKVLFAIANPSNKASLLMLADNRGVFHPVYEPDTIHILQQYPKLSADGSRIVFSLRDTASQGKYHVMVVDADGTHLHSVCDDESYETQPGISPDGQYVAYYESTDVDTFLVVAKSDGSGANRIARVTDPMVDFAGEAVFTPDGFRITYTDNGHIYVIDRDGSNRVDVGEGLSPRWRPGMNTVLAFVRNPGDFQWDIMVTPDLGKSVVNITETNAQWDLYPEWSPDGRYIVCETGTGDPDRSTSSIKLIEVGTGATKLLGSPGVLPLFTR